MEVRQEVLQIISNLPDEALEEILRYLRQIERPSVEKMSLSANLHIVVDEDSELLEKLAK